MHILERLQSIHKGVQLSHRSAGWLPQLQISSLSESGQQLCIGLISLVAAELALSESLDPCGIHNAYSPACIRECRGRGFTVRTRRLEHYRHIRSQMPL